MKLPQEQLRTLNGLSLPLHQASPPPMKPKVNVSDSRYTKPANRQAALVTRKASWLEKPVFYQDPAPAKPPSPEHNALVSERNAHARTAALLGHAREQVRELKQDKAALLQKITTLQARCAELEEVQQKHDRDRQQLLERLTGDQ